MIVKRKINFWVIGINLFIISVLGFVLMRGYSAYAAQKKQWRLQDQKLTNVKAEIQHIQDSLAAYEEEKKEFEKYLFKDKDIPSFLEGVARFAEEASVNVADMKTKKFKQVKTARQAPAVRSNRRHPKKAESQAAAKEQSQLTLAALPIEMKVQGPYNSLLKFLNELENFEQLLTISDIEFSSSRDYPLLSCVFILNIYSFKTIGELN